MSKYASDYQVLARKYRPEILTELVGQDALVRTLRNSFEADRIAHAFIMTGIRGTGKTTTARIIAKGMNCVGSDGKGKPTINPCGQCEHCLDIMQGRHVDVMEMDAASRTGVDDVREIIDSVHYRAASARFKIYIIDEVHMLSNNAFNALLKTLEEPPEHVKFIFATTEIRKVPVTVLSRCQRFDLRRIEPEIMMTLLRKIALAENASITDEALALITRAAEGSARDAQSLLDQAISNGDREVSAAEIRSMIGLADRGRVMDLFAMIMKGDARGALGELGAQYADGADPMAVLRDLAEITHWISVVKITPQAVDDPTISPDERIRGNSFAKSLSMRVLARSWQMLLKALEEVASAPNTMMASEMVIIRLTHVAELPTPDELVKKLADKSSPSSQRLSDKNPSAGAYSNQSSAKVSSYRSGMVVSQAEISPSFPLSPEQSLLSYPTFSHITSLIQARRDIKLLMDVENHVQLVKYKPGQIEFEPTLDAPIDLAQRLSSSLQAWTGIRWAVSLVSEKGEPTIFSQRHAKEDAIQKKIEEHPLMQAVFASFPKASILNIKTAEQIKSEVESEALPEIDENWDPFEEH